jgi:hypothetical protein
MGATYVGRAVLELVAVATGATAPVRSAVKPLALRRTVPLLLFLLRFFLAFVRPLPDHNVGFGLGLNRVPPAQVVLMLQLLVSVDRAEHGVVLAAFVFVSLASRSLYELLEESCGSAPVMIAQGRGDVEMATHTMVGRARIWEQERPMVDALLPPLAQSKCDRVLVGV